MEVAGPSSAVVPWPRLVWLDFYRGLAVVGMVETHVVNTFLDASAWESPWRGTLNYFNGLIAPAFLLIAGIAQGLGGRSGRAAGPRLWRLAGIGALGYAMHFPVASVLAGRWEEAWRLGSQMDVLVCLAIALGVNVAVERWCGRAAEWILAALAIGVVLLARPAVDWISGPVPLVAAVNRTTGSLFPLLPWAGFVFVGFCVSSRAPSWRGLLPGIFAFSVPVLVLGRTNLTGESIPFFFERLVWITALLPVCAWLSARWSPGWLLYAGRESLVMYLAHLGLIEVLAMGGRNQLGVTATAALFPVVLGATFAVTLGWRRFTVWRGDRARRAARLPENSARAA